MSVWRLVIREIAHRRLSVALGLLSVSVGVGSLVAAFASLRAHDRRTREILSRKEHDLRQRISEMTDNTRRAMLHLGFNVTILPRDQNLADWYADDYASKCMPEEYVTRLRQSGIVTIEHLVPRLRQRVEWPETKWTVQIVGTGSRLAKPSPRARALTLKPLPKGKAILGYEVHHGLGLEVGGRTQLMGREFLVQDCLGETGEKDDMTVWINLRDAQELLDKEGLINEIAAVECRTAWANLPKVESEIAGILPDTQVVEASSKVLAKTHALMKMAEEGETAIQREVMNRARLRNARERSASMAATIVMVVCAAWLMLMSFRNVRDRTTEIGIFRAIGYRSSQILWIFLARSLALGLVGGVLDFLAGGIWEALDLRLFGLAMSVALGLTAVACVAPAMHAARQDPAAILRRE